MEGLRLRLDDQAAGLHHGGGDPLGRVGTGSLPQSLGGSLGVAEQAADIAPDRPEVAGQVAEAAGPVDLGEQTAVLLLQGRPGRPGFLQQEFDGVTVVASAGRRQAFGDEAIRAHFLVGHRRTIPRGPGGKRDHRATARPAAGARPAQEEATVPATNSSEARKSSASCRVPTATT